MFIGDDTDKSMVLVFNKYISGYHLEAGSSEGNIGIPFVYDEKEEDAKYETVSLKYNKDKEKNIFIYTPKEYDKMIRIKSILSFICVTVKIFLTNCQLTKVVGMLLKV